MGSTIPTASAALYALLDAASYPQITLVSDGPPPSHSEARVGVMVGDTADNDATQEWATLGNSDREERYGITVQIDCLFADQSAAEARTAAYAVAAVVEATVKSNPTLGVVPAGASFLSAQLARLTHQLIETDQGWLVRIPTAVLVQARI